MATGIAEIGAEVGLGTAEVLGTALLTLTIATVVVGAMTMLVGEVNGGSAGKWIGDVNIWMFGVTPACAPCLSSVVSEALH